MKKISDLDEWHENCAGKEVGVTIGNFDGVHLGHKSLLKAFKELCRKKSLLPIVFTFKPHPELFFHPSKKHLLTDYEHKYEIIQGLGFEHIVEISFNESIRKLTGNDFANSKLFKHKGLKLLWVGHDFTFGCDKQDPAAVLSNQSQSIELGKAQAFTLDGEVVSSSLIRECLRHSLIEKANSLLGRKHSLRGTVVHGKKLGRELGFPTLNLKLDYPACLPGDGVYAISCLVNGATFNGAMNIGQNPSTDAANETKIEVHLFNYNESAYGKKIEVFLESFVREERRFDSLEELKAQIQSDIKNIKERLH